MGGTPGWTLGRGAARRQRDDRLRRRVDVEHRCTWGAVEWTWDAVAFGRRRCTVVGNGFTDGHGLEGQSVLAITSERLD